MNNATVKFARCAVFTALTAVLSQISIPLPAGVPINLATFSVFCAGALLGAYYGALSMTAYAVLGAAGLPVFAGFGGGLGTLAGKTGGYIAGYVAAAFITGLAANLTAKLFKRGNPARAPFLALGMAAGLIACYTLGTAWFMFVTGLSLAPSLTHCVLPFLIGDAVKITLAAALCFKVEPLINKARARARVNKPTP